MKRFSLIVLSIAFLVSEPNAETPYQITDMVILPPKFYVGDLVELRLRLQFASSAEITPVDTLPQTKWITVKDVQLLSIDEERAELKIFFSSYHPGTHLLPELQLGDIVIRNLKVNTSSVLEEEGGQKLRPLKNQAVIPLTWFKITAILISACIIPLLLVKGGVLAAAKIHEYRRRRRKTIPFERVQSALNRLNGRHAEKNPKLFHQELSSRMREYLEHRLGITAETYTTSELQSVLPMVVSDDRVTANIISILRTSDNVKFGNRITSVQDMDELVRQAKQMIGAVEKEQADVES